MSWSIDIDPPTDLQVPDSDNHWEPSPEEVAKEASGAHNESNAQKYQVSDVPSAKEMRMDTLEGIKIGILPEYQDYGIVLQYLVNQFIKNNFKFEKVLNNVPWLGSWLVNPFNARLLNEELELAAKLEASKIQQQINYMLQGGFCTRTCGRFFGCVCCCMPVCAVCCKIGAYFSDLCISFLWGTLCAWWLGVFCRRYVLTYLCYIPKFIKLKFEDVFTGDSGFEDEELSIRNIYDSNSYRIANHYACLLFLAIVLTALGSCMVIVSYIYLPEHPDQLFVRAESVLGIILLASGCFGLQFYCRCTL